MSTYFCRMTVYSFLFFLIATGFFVILLVLIYNLLSELNPPVELSSLTIKAKSYFNR